MSGHIIIKILHVEVEFLNLLFATIKGYDFNLMCPAPHEIGYFLMAAYSRNRLYVEEMNSTII